MNTHMKHLMIVISVVCLALAIRPGDACAQKNNYRMSVGADLQVGGAPDYGFIDLGLSAEAKLIPHFGVEIGAYVQFNKSFRSMGGNEHAEVSMAYLPILLKYYGPVNIAAGIDMPLGGDGGYTALDIRIGKDIRIGRRGWAFEPSIFIKPVLSAKSESILESGDVPGGVSLKFKHRF